jgi:SAM-dependent methyltransferase
MAISTGNEDLRLSRMAGLVKGRERVLDIGSADKPNQYLHARQVVSLDLEPHEMPANYSEQVIGNAMHLPRPFSAGQFDAITAGEILEHLEDPMSFLRACRETLAPDGLLVLSTPNPNSPIEQLLTINLSRRFFYTSEHLMLFPQRWLIRMLERSGFSEVRLHSGGFPIPLLGLVPFPRPWCYQTIARAVRRK